MEELKALINDLTNISNKIKKEMVKAQQETAQSICKDAQSLAPGTKYKSSIKVGKTKISANEISTSIYTDEIVTANSTGNSYNLGFLLETGTNPHAIPNAFDWGRIYGYESEQYQRTLQPDWHPGFPAMPHFIPALNKNKSVYEKNIGKILDEVFK